MSKVRSWQSSVVAPWLSTSWNGMASIGTGDSVTDRGCARLPTTTRSSSCTAAGQRGVLHSGARRGDSGQQHGNTHQWRHLIVMSPRQVAQLTSEAVVACARLRLTRIEVTQGVPLGWLASTRRTRA